MLILRNREPSTMSESRTVNSERRAQIGMEKRARTRAAILEATFEVIGHEYGRLARIDQVTELAQIARPTFYTYFSSMEELLAALSYDLSHDFNSAVLAYCANLHDHAEEAGAAIRYYLGKAAGDHKWGWGMVNISLGGPIFGAETCAAATATIAGGIEAGAFNAVDVNVGRDMLLGTTVAAMTTLLRGACPHDYPERVAQQILIGLGVPRQRAQRIASKALPDPMLTLQSGGVAPIATKPSKRVRSEKGAA